MNHMEKLTGADWALFGLALLLLAPPVVVIMFLNDADAASFFTSSDGRAYFLSYCSFWLAAMAGLTAGRGVVRHQRGTPKAELAIASIQDYIESGMLLVSSACALALTAHDDLLPHRTFLNLLIAYPIVYAGYLLVLKVWEKGRLRGKKGGFIAIGGTSECPARLFGRCLGCGCRDLDHGPVCRPDPGRVKTRSKQQPDDHRAPCRDQNMSEGHCAGIADDRDGAIGFLLHRGKAGGHGLHAGQCAQQ